MLLPEKFLTPSIKAFLDEGEDLELLWLAGLEKDSTRGWLVRPVTRGNRIETDQALAAADRSIATVGSRPVLLRRSSDQDHHSR